LTSYIIYAAFLDKENKTVYVTWNYFQRSLKVFVR